MTEYAAVAGFCLRHHSFFCPCAAPWLYGEAEKAAYESGEAAAEYERFEDEVDDEDAQLGFRIAKALR